MECIKVTKTKDGKFLEFEFENGHVYDPPMDWFTHDQEYFDIQLEHMRGKIWFNHDIERQMFELVPELPIPLIVKPRRHKGY